MKLRFNLILIVLLFLAAPVFAEENLTYSSYVDGTGWTEEVTPGNTCGTTGQAKRLEAVKITDSSGVRYRTHLEDTGWTDWVDSGETSGLPGGKKRVEALSIELTNADYDIYYRAHVSDLGWLDWAKNGENAGSEGLAKQMEAFEIVLTPAGSAPPGETTYPFVTKENLERFMMPNKAASAHIGDIGWRDFDLFETTIGTTGQNKKLEALKLYFEDSNGSIEYNSHLTDIGWEKDWTQSGGLSGTTGQNRAMQAVRIRLTGNNAELYDIYYRAHAQNVGWMDWAKNGEPAGTTGANLNLEAIEIVLVDKGGEAPGRTDEPCYTPISKEAFKKRIHGCWLELARAEEPLKSYISGISDNYLYFGQNETFNGLEGTYEVVTAGTNGGRIRFTDGFSGETREAYMDFENIPANHLKIRIDGIEEREMVLGDTTDGVHYTFSGLMQNGQLAVITLRERP